MVARSAVETEEDRAINYGPYSEKYETLHSIGKGAFGFVKLALRRHDLEKVHVFHNLICRITKSTKCPVYPAKTQISLQSDQILHCALSVKSSQGPKQGYHGQGKISRKLKNFQVREKSGNFGFSQGNLERIIKVRVKSVISEFSETCNYFGSLLKIVSINCL